MSPAYVHAIERLSWPHPRFAPREALPSNPLKENEMKKLGKAMMAGLVATVVLSVLMVMKSAMGVMPELDLPRMIAGMMGMPDAPAIGWAVHFMIGVVGYGAALALVGERLPGGSLMWRGVFLATLGWLVMLVVLMPMAGAGLFGMRLGVAAPLMTLMLHLVFGAVLGGYYGHAIGARSARAPLSR